MKTCHACSTVKPIDAFGVHRSRPDGRQTQCRDCISAWRTANRDLIRDTGRAYYEANRAARIEAAGVRKKKNRQRANEQARKKFAETGNTPKRLESLRAYQARKRRAMPAWADRARILEFYEAAKEQGAEVDHIVPLRSPLVCGLHCEFNLQVLPRSANRAKSNRTWPDMP